jgi:cytochrome bd-I ubiquinol oxidase subunit X
MWYLAWVLGLPFACLFAILNAIWFEFKTMKDSNSIAGLVDTE